MNEPTPAPAPAVQPTPVRASYTRRAARSGGVHVHDAVAAAEARLGEMRDAVTAEVDRLLTVLAGWRPETTPGNAAPQPIRAAVDSLVGLCAYAELPELGRIAGSCCRLLGRDRDERFADAWRVHMTALTLFRTTTNSEARRTSVDQVVKGLHLISSTATSHG